MRRAAASLGAIVQQLRQAAGLTRTQLADETGLPIDSISQLESGRQAAPAWMVYRLLKSSAMNKLPGRAHDLALRLDRGDLLVVDALARYHAAAGIPRPLRSQLRQYFSPVLTTALAELTATGLATAQRASRFWTLIQRLPTQTEEQAAEFLDFCTRAGWFPANPLRTNGTALAGKTRVRLAGHR
jgi:DNA-binding XRE family transcriptional regulator